MHENEKNLVSVDINNPTAREVYCLSQLRNFYFSSECKKINIDKWKKIN